MAVLNVKLNDVAAIRQSRNAPYPDPAAAAVLAELGGAAGICVHRWLDGRHVSERDLSVLASMIQTRFIMEVGPFAENVGLVQKIRPDRVTLVNEDADAATVSSGLDLMIFGDFVTESAAAMKRSDLEVCVSVDPEPEQIKLAHRAGAEMVEIHAGAYLEASTRLKRNRIYLKILDAINLAAKLKMKVSVGHGLGYQTVDAFRSISNIEEVTIGHGIVSRAVLTGMEPAVREMVRCLNPTASA